MKVKKKPIEVEAIRWTKGNEKEVESFLNMMLGVDLYTSYSGEALYIETLEGTMMAKQGDYIIKGVDGEFYPCKPDIFDKTYDIVEY